MKVFCTSLFFLLSIFVGNAQNLVRGPYLQIGTSSSMTIRWNTKSQSIGSVKFGSEFGKKELKVSEITSNFDHIVTISDLKPNSKYFYSIEVDGVLLQGDENNYFITSPEKGSKEKFRMVAFGDCGTSTPQQLEVVNRVKEYFGKDPINGWLLLGDNAYSYGYLEEYQKSFFGVYDKFFLKNTVLWPAPGNHDYAGQRTWTANSPNRPAYYNLFSLPTNGECGGVASKNEAFYSFDYGNVHFLSLDSFGNNDGLPLFDTLSSQMAWLKKDLKANTLKWTVVYFHHPPYTMSTHNSDTELDLVALRQNLAKTLEELGVDLVLNGHSHGYERSYFMNNHYGMENTFELNKHAVSTSSGKYDGSVNSCPYIKSDAGTVYVVAGSSGWVGSPQVSFPHSAMISSNMVHTGALVLEVEDNRFDVKFLTEKGEIYDKFTMFKDVNKLQKKEIACGEKIAISPSWKGIYKPELGNLSTSNVVILDSLNMSLSFKIRDLQGCLSDTVKLTVSDYPKPIASSNYPKFEGEELKLEGKIEGKGELVWKGPNNFSATGSLVSIQNATLQKNGKYVLTANYKTCTASDTIIIDLSKILALENETGNVIKVYPNPSESYFNVEVNVPLDGVYETKLISSAGMNFSEVKTFFLRKGKNTLELSSDIKGLAHFLIKSDSFEAATKVIIK